MTWAILRWVWGVNMELFYLRIYYLQRDNVIDFMLYGVLELLRQQPGFEEVILPQIILKADERVGVATRSAIAQLISAPGSAGLIVRTSNPADWAGMVDAMPTVECRPEHAESIVDQVIEISKDPALTEYSQKEGTGYDPKNTTVSIAPYLKCFAFCTVTEHPNLEGVVYSDFFQKSRLDTFYDSYNYHPTEGTHRLRGGTEILFEDEKAKILDAVLRLRDRIRGTGLFDDADALQFELGLAQENFLKPYLFQVRRLSAKNLAQDAEKGRGRYHFRNSRIFGITSKKEIKLPVSRHMWRDEAIVKGDKNMPSGYILYPECSSDRLSISAMPTSMKGYIPGQRSNAASLEHNHTRFVQRALNTGGFALLTDVPSDFEDRSIVTFISNGIEGRLTI